MNTNKHKYFVSILWLHPSWSQATTSCVGARATWRFYRELHNAIAVTHTEPAAGHGVSWEFQKPSNPIIRSKYLTTSLEISAKITIASFFVLLLYFQPRAWLSELIYLQLTFKSKHLLLHRCCSPASSSCLLWIFSKHFKPLNWIEGFSWVGSWLSSTNSQPFVSPVLTMG